MAVSADNANGHAVRVDRDHRVQTVGFARAANVFERLAGSIGTGQWHRASIVANGRVARFFTAVIDRPYIATYSWVHEWRHGRSDVRHCLHGRRSRLRPRALRAAASGSYPWTRPRDSWPRGFPARSAITCGACWRRS